MNVVLIIKCQSYQIKFLFIPLLKSFYAQFYHYCVKFKLCDFQENTFRAERFKHYNSFFMHFCRLDGSFFLCITSLPLWENLICYIYIYYIVASMQYYTLY